MHTAQLRIATAIGGRDMLLEAAGIIFHLHEELWIGHTAEAVRVQVLRWIGGCYWRTLHRCAARSPHSELQHARMPCGLRVRHMEHVGHLQQGVRQRNPNADQELHGASRRREDLRNSRIPEWHKHAVASVQHTALPRRLQVHNVDSLGLMLCDLRLGHNVEDPHMHRAVQQRQVVLDSLRCWSWCRLRLGAMHGRQLSWIRCGLRPL